MHAYRAEDAETIVVALGSVVGTIKDTVDELRAQRVRIGVVAITCFRPWPLAAVRAALAGARRIVVLEKALGVGIGGIVANNVRAALPDPATEVYTLIAGLGGRAITKASLAKAFADAIAGRLEATTFLDLDREVVGRVLAREREVRRSGPIAENVLKQVGPVAARPG